jgi:ProP effector
LAWLFATYPTLFRHQDKKPLKIGIHQELIPLMRAAGFSLKVAKRAIHFYVTRLSYQIALVQGGHRYDLADNPCGQVTPAEQEMARDKVKQLLKAGAENKPKKRVNHS